ncbi:MAG: tyrosine-type recombinase/integrase [Thermoplasmata archaeon]
MANLLNSNYFDYTRETYKTMVRKFYKQFPSDGKRYLEFLEDFRFKVDPNSIRPEKLITQEEENAMVKIASSPRERASISTLFASGARIGELLNMRIGDLRFYGCGTALKIMGSKRTGYRLMGVIGNSMVYPRTWLENHPARNNGEVWLFCSLCERGAGQKLNYWDVYTALKRAVGRAGIKRRIHPQLFRHTHGPSLP